MKKNAAMIREEEIRPDDIFSEFVRLSAEDAEQFFDKSEFQEVPCPGCGCDRVAASFTKHTFKYNNCFKCGSIYVSPRPNKAELLRYYATSKSQTYWVETILKRTGEQRKASILIPCIDRIEGIIKEKGRKPCRFLDIGAANGACLAEWNKRYPEAEIIGIEPGEEAAKKCRDIGAIVFEDFVENIAGQNGAQGDLVTCFEVVEHIQEPKSFAKAIYDVTSPGGMAVMTCLGADGFDIQLLWEKSRSISPPYHLNFLSIPGMHEMFRDAGFNEVEVFTPGRLDVEIVKRSMDRGVLPDLSRFEKLLLARGEETLKAFQKFLAENCLSSHVWIIATRE
jgi:SAM-dependent methyltransferase